LQLGSANPSEAAMPRRPSLPTKSTRATQNRTRPLRHSGLLDNRAVADALISLAGMVGLPVENQAGAEVGRVADVVARWDGGSYPPATGLVVRIGRRPAYLPISQVQAIESDKVRLRSARLDLRDFQRRTGEVVLGRDVLDRQLVDVDGVRVVRASDLYLARVGLSWRLVGVDVGMASLLRRLGPARYRNRATPERVLDWAMVQPFGANPGELRLAHSNHALHRLRPSEVADLLEELGRDERQELLDALEPEDAADALEEMQPEELEQLLRDAPRPKAAALLEAMEPDEAVDALRDLEPDERSELLAVMDRSTAAELTALLNYEEESAGGLMTTHLVRVARSAPVARVREVLRVESEASVDVDRVVVVDDEGILVQDIGLLALLTANDDTEVGALLEATEPVTVGVHDPLVEVVDRLVDSRATSVVVVDGDDRPVGRILADDLIDALVPDRNRFRFPRILK
jgi:CBS domain-containing protein